MFIDKFHALCAHIGRAPTSVTHELGISNGAYSGWTKGGEPQNATKRKIADYFGITVQELDSDSAEPCNEKDSELCELLQACKDRPDLRMMFQTFKGAKTSDVLKVIADYQQMRGD